MEAILLLADYAEAVNGKLYLSGAGWRQILAVPGMSFSLAVQLAVPWDSTNQAHEMTIALHTDDGQSVSGPDGLPINIGGKFEVGRPAGLKKGTSIQNVFAFRFQAIPLSPGGYVFDMDIDGQEVAHAAFDVLPLPTGFIQSS